MNHNSGTKTKPDSYKPHSPDHCKPCPKPPQRNCIIPFTPLQADIFETLLDNLIASIQSVYIPPAGPLPNVLKVLQNLFKDMRLTLRDKAGLFAATELNITAYEQSEDWSAALIAATGQTLTELYAFSLLACVSSPVKDGWVSRIRLAETNLAGITNLVPPAIPGTLLVLDGGKTTTSLSVNSLTGLPSQGAIPITNSTSESIPVTTNSLGQNVSIVLADNFGGNNLAFSMPQSTTVTSITASFFPQPTTILAGTITVQVQLCRALPDFSLYQPLVAIPGTVFSLLPILTGVVPRDFSCQITQSGLNIPVNAEDRLALVFTITASQANPDLDTLFGTIEGTITFAPAEEEAPGQIVPFASRQTVDLTGDAAAAALTLGVVGFGNSNTQINSNTGTLSPVDASGFMAFTDPIQQSGTLTTLAAYFSLTSGSTLPESPSTLVAVYRFTDTNNEAAVLSFDAITNLSFLPPGTYTETSPASHGTITGLNIPVNAGDRLLIVFSMNFVFVGGAATGWGSGGAFIELNSD
ncbi:hypothetical protein M3223_21370 [Paenibacillus pasadenensis]|uniref:hypothetical protein n=1 Tax=Paenibacillus pasadenensis TaxID=217090 RepID=UPI0020420242|nr:hypothetical protein [Paenibacillus pasadenensis]MCM3749888.1 hypothetical protein [Paenibacillus pasadenensis]